MRKVAKNNPRKLKVEFDRKAKAAGTKVGDVHAEIAEALETQHAKLSPIQQKQFPIKKNPVTGKGGFTPNWERVESLIREIGETEPTLVKGLQRKLANAKSRWEATDKSYGKLLENKRRWGSKGKWQKDLSTKDAASNQLNKAIHNAYNDTLNQTAEFILKKKYPNNPKKWTKLSDANQLFAAYKNLEPVIDMTSAFVL